MQDINELRRLWEMGQISTAELEQAQSQNALRDAVMPQPRYDLAPMEQNTMRIENGPEAGKVIPMNFAQAGPPAPKLGEAIEYMGRKGRYSADGRNIVFGDGSTHDLFPERTKRLEEEKYVREKRAADLKQAGIQAQRGEAEIEQTRLQTEAMKAPKQAPAPAGYRWTGTGALERIPGGPADEKFNEDERKKAASGQNTLELLDMAEPLIAGSTGSGVGALADMLAGTVGYATDGAKNIAKLKTLQGQLVAKMPRMEGPQSNYDVKLYQEMAGQLADPTIPVEQRQAALATLRELNAKYATAPAAPAPTAPAPAAPAGAPRPGEVRKGYRFKGGDPSKQSSWEKV
jgi:hypothetical protein